MNSSGEGIPPVEPPAGRPEEQPVAPLAPTEPATEQTPPPANEGQQPPLDPFERLQQHVRATDVPVESRLSDQELVDKITSGEMQPKTQLPPNMPKRRRFLGRFRRER